MPSDLARDLLTDLLDVVLPVTCAGCGAAGCGAAGHGAAGSGAAGRALCAACLLRWSAAPRRCEHAAGRLDRMDGTVLPVWALAVNDAAVRRAVGAWKDGGRVDVTPWFAAVLTRAVRALAPVVPARPGRRLLVVAAPPSPAGLARRGEDLVAALAVAAAGSLAETRRAGPGPLAVRALRLSGRGRDQVGLGLRGRAANLAGRVRVRPRHAAALRGADVLLVDDVLTTGATLAACRAAVEAAGGHPVGAVVLAVTPPPGAPRGWLEPPADQG
jgi:predicted amidophosphoribosyltransferase